jgi:hypothetical protein
MADWQAFATSFLTGVASDINKRKDKAEDYETQQRDLAERNKAIMSKRKTVSNAVKSKTAKLRDMGVSEEVIRTAISSGPTGLTDLEKHMDTAVTTHGREAVKKNADVFASVDVDPTVLRMRGEDALTMDEYINQSFGMAAPTPGSVEAGKGTVWDRMLGRGARERVKAELDQEMTDLGYSIYDINEAAAQSEYESLAPGSFVNFGTRKTFTVDNKAREMEYLRSQINTMKAGNSEYKALETKEASLMEALATAEAAGRKDEAAEKRAELAVVQGKKSRMDQQFIGDHVLQMGENFGDGSYQKIMGPAIDAILGQQGWTASLFGQEPETDDKGTVNRVKQETPIIVGTTNVEVEAEVGKIESDDVWGGTPMTVVVGKDGNEYVRVDDNVRVSANGVDKVYRKGDLIDAEASQIIIGNAGVAPVESVAPTGPTTRPTSNRVKRSIEAGMAGEDYTVGVDPMADRLLSDNGDAIIAYAEQEGIDNGASDEELTQILSEWAVANNEELPVDKTTLLKGMRYGLEPATEEEQTDEATSTEPAATTSVETDQVEADATTDRILKTNGRQIVALAEKEGLTEESTDEEIVQILSEWAVANKETLPFDKEALVYGIRFGLGL